MKVGMYLGKVKKFGIGWCIPHRMAADNTEGGSGQTPASNRVKQACWFIRDFRVDTPELFYEDMLQTLIDH
jgi:hypothetical protein